MTSSRALPSFWTALFAALAAFFGAFRRRGAAAGASGVSGASGASGVVARVARTSAAVARTAVPNGAVRVPRQWRRSGSGALPPTLKQRIRAEAHGSSPAPRRVVSGPSFLTPGASWPAHAYDLTA
ncbi:DUF6344 domain-containing protein [Streptomyces sp. NRRL S-87]|uniref:DUF6344 domain-containing protein n=1 Tax=Streptomyces sp. NRRL S-87 TaxID=1463920 RepID=UPI00068F5278|nr:DUF6344 domain-containing protein [Streptomyces sp. NRRL S-87]